MLTERRDRAILIAVDGSAWAVALTAAAALRYELDLTQIDVAGLVMFVPFAVAGQWTIGAASRLYRGRHCVGSCEESLHQAGIVLLTGLVLFFANLLAATPLVPRSVPLIAAPLALLTGWAVRVTIRRHGERALLRDRCGAQRVVILGAGNAGRQLAAAMLADPAGEYLPVAFVDDDPGKRNLRACGVAVRGTRSDLAEVVAETGATLVVVAVPDPPDELLREVSHLAGAAGAGVKIMPRLSELFRPTGGLADLRDLDLAGLLGRRQVDMGTGVDGRLTGARVLVTGAGGSIGAELCRQISRHRPAALFMVDHDESALHAVRLSIYGSAMLDSPDVVLADIRDPDSIRRVFEACRPDVVFHAAALKHLPMLERFPLEAWKTNVLGTLNVIEAAGATGVSTLVNISTDKAANPTSVLGRSKRVGERLVAHAGTVLDGTFLSVRFGNVLGSRGSVLATFAAQLASGGPLTVTHPEVTRFFMTISEAVQLVITAATVGRSGQVLVLDMGAPVRIADVANHLVRQAGGQARIVYTGLRDGEKLHEELFGHDETCERTEHPFISRLAVPPLRPDRLAELVLAGGEIAAMTECSKRFRSGVAV